MGYGEKQSTPLPPLLHSKLMCFSTGYSNNGTTLNGESGGGLSGKSGLQKHLIELNLTAGVIGKSVYIKHARTSF